MTGYTEIDGICEPCQENCDICSSLSSCDSCSDGYFMVLNSDGEESGICSACASSCLTCEKSHNKCKSCASGYHFDGWKCVSDMQVHLTITLDCELNEFLNLFDQLKSYIFGLLKGII